MLTRTLGDDELHQEKQIFTFTGRKRPKKVLFTAIENRLKSVYFFFTTLLKILMDSNFF